MSEKQQKHAIHSSRTREKQHERRDIKQELNRPDIDISKAFIPIQCRKMEYNA